MDYKKLNQTIADYHGADRQINELIDKLAILIKSTIAWRKVYINEEVGWNVDRILIESVADVENAIEQLKYIVNMSEDKLDEMKRFKLNHEKNKIYLGVRDV